MQLIKCLGYALAVSMSVWGACLLAGGLQELGGLFRDLVGVMRC